MKTLAAKTPLVHSLLTLAVSLVLSVMTSSAQESDALPEVTVAASDAMAWETGPDPGSFTILRAVTTGEPLTVYFTLGGTAGNGTDYETLPASATIPAWEGWVSLDVTPINDLEAEGRETVVLTLLPNAAYRIGSPNSATVTIADNDSAPAAVWVEDAVPAGAWTGADGGEPWNWVTDNPAPFSGTRAHQSALAPGMHYHYFSQAADTLTVKPDDTLFTHVFLDSANPPREIMLQWFDGLSWADAAYWGENLMSWASEGSARYMGALPVVGQWARLEVPASSMSYDSRTFSGMKFVLFDGRATWDFSGNAPGTVSVTATDANASESGDTGTFTIWRSGSRSSQPLTVYYTISGSAQNGSDYQSLPGSVTISADSDNATVTVTPIDDSLAEGDETVVLTIVTNANYNVGSPNSAAITVADNDSPTPGPPVVTVTATDGTASETGPDTGTFKISRSGSTDSALTVRYTLSGGAINGRDYQILPTSVTIPAGASSASVIVTPIDDSEIETSETVELTLNSDAAYSIGSPGADTVVILDNDQPPPSSETVWVEDSVPTGAWTGADGGDSWNWISNNPTPFSGTLSHQSALVAGIHYHYFSGATATLPVNSGETLLTYVFLDPANPPREIMLQWFDGASWEHRAYWGGNLFGGANLIPWGTDGTASRRPMGALPAAGQWVRLEVPANLVGLEGRTITGMNFILYDGQATWDYCEKSRP